MVTVVKTQGLPPQGRDPDAGPPRRPITGTIGGDRGRYGGEALQASGRRENRLCHLDMTSSGQREAHCGGIDLAGKLPLGARGSRLLPVRREEIATASRSPQPGPEFGPAGGCFLLGGGGKTTLLFSLARTGPG